MPQSQKGEVGVFDGSWRLVALNGDRRHVNTRRITSE